jgi:CO/xanthine dehydrogenase Mo-binding subunit
MRSSHRDRPNYQGIGAPLRRVEDRRFLLGRGRFVADIDLPGALHCALVRSPHAHARIRAIDVSAAIASPGVTAVLTGADMAADGRRPCVQCGPCARGTAAVWNESSISLHPVEFAFNLRYIVAHYTFLARECRMHTGVPHGRERRQIFSGCAQQDAARRRHPQ